MSLAVLRVPAVARGFAVGIDHHPHRAAADTGPSVLSRVLRMRRFGRVDDVDAVNPVAVLRGVLLDDGDVGRLLLLFAAGESEDVAGTRALELLDPAPTVTARRVGG